MTKDDPRQGTIRLLPRVVLRRLLQAIPSLFIVSIVAFSLMAATPGDPLTARLDREALVRMSEAEVAAARAQFGLDQPVPVQYARWLSHVAQGDLGYSIVTGRAALTEVTDRLGPSVILLAGALIVALAIGLPAGILAARKPGGRLDRALSAAVVTVVATPPFVVGLVLIYVLAIRAGLLPTGGMGVAGEPRTFAMVMRHLLLPALVLGLANAAPLARYSRAAMVEVLASDYIRTARSTGAPESLVIRQHGLRNASLPVITLVAVMVPDLIASSVITEQVFAWPGIGSLIIKSAQAADAPVLMVVVVMVALTTLTVNLLADIAYSIADPRVRLG